MKKMIKLLISIFIFIPLIINARVNYEDATQYSNNYIYNFEEYNDYIYLENDIPYEYKNNKNIINANFKSGGFLSRNEYEISNIKGNSYLSNGLQYWTLTKSSYLKHYIVDYKLVEELDSNSSGVRITEFTKPDVVVSGTGSYGNPWTFDGVLSIHINSDNIIRGKVSTVECSDINMRKESIHLNVVGDNPKRFYICPEEGYKFLKSTCSQYITNHNINNMYTIDNLDRDNVICKISYSYSTNPITIKGCESCSTGKTDRTIYVNNTHKVWLSDPNGTQKIETIGDLPTKTGYTFNGYYTSDSQHLDTNRAIESNGNLTYNEQLTSADTLYPYMKANEYTVKYNCNNGGGTTEQSTHTYDSEKALTSNGCTRKGYKFEGWSKTKTGSVKYTNSESVKNLTSDNNGSVTLYAVWTECPKGTYGSNGTTCTKCVAGTYNSNTASTSSNACLDCVAGTYSSEGASSCTKCDVGRYSETIAATSSSVCKKCDLGYYASNKGSTKCEKCPKGTYADKKGLSECISCGTGYTSPEGSDSKEDCEVATTLPSFKYTGKFQVVKDNDNKISDVLTKKTFTGTDYTYTGNWKVRFLSDGKLTVYSLGSASKGSDFFIVGGGANGKGVYTYTCSNGNGTCFCGGAGGAGGTCKTKKTLTLSLNTEYEIDIGAAASKSSIKIGDNTYSAAGGGGASGAGGWCDSSGPGAKGTDGCYEFDSSSYSKYAGGGGGGGNVYSVFGGTWQGGAGGAGGGGNGGQSFYWPKYPDDCRNGSAGGENTGGGGGGAGQRSCSAGAGGSGIVIWRNSR